MRHLIFGALFGFCGLAACQTTTTSNTVPTQTPVATAAVSGGMMSLLNAQRTAQGLSPLRENARLSRAARDHAADMVAKGYFSHTGADGSQFFERAMDAGYNCPAAENIASGQQTEVEVVGSWMNSAGHRRNILLSDARDFGIGRVDNVWVLLLGRGC